MSFIKISFFLQVIYLCLIIDVTLGQITANLRCISCTSSDPRCTSTAITNFVNLSTEPCSTRCYVRQSSTGVITRGCDSGFYFKTTPPNNGCQSINGESWCFCSTLQTPSCNYQAINNNNNNGLIIDYNLGYATSCAVLNCKNGGSCSSCINGVFYCECTNLFTGPYCDTRMN